MFEIQLSEGLAALGAYGILLIVNNQVLSFSDSLFSKLRDKRSIFLFLLPSLIGLNLGIAQMIYFIGISGVFDLFKESINWIKLALLAPVVLPQGLILMKMLARLKLYRTFLYVPLFYTSFTTILLVFPSKVIGFAYVIVNIVLLVGLLWKLSRNTPFSKDYTNIGLSSHWNWYRYFN